MKIKYLILCFVASLLASCGEIDESNLKLYPSKLYLGVSGYNLQEIYDLGEESLVWDVYVDKSGYYDNAASRIVVRSDSTDRLSGADSGGTGFPKYYLSMSVLWGKNA